MQITHKNRLLLIVTTSILVVGGIVLFFLSKDTSSIPLLGNTPGSTTTPSEPEVVLKPIPKASVTYHNVMLPADKPYATLVSLVGEDHIAQVLSLNRIDKAHVRPGITVVVPDSFEDPMALSSFPEVVPELASVPKIMLISQDSQEFGAYESGRLVRFGGISTGKKSTPTGNKLYFTNWKGKEVVSTVDDEWILKWNFNIANADGIGIHEYELPGYPASHSCVRLSAVDAEWFYSWADQWILSKEDTFLAEGTPVIIFGDYPFGKTAPWKLLPEDKDATTITLETIQNLVNPQLEKIQQKRERREEVLSKQTR